MNDDDVSRDESRNSGFLNGEVDAFNQKKADSFQSAFIGKIEGCDGSQKCSLDVAASCQRKRA